MNESTQNITLQPRKLEHAAFAFPIINAHRSTLSEWLPWVHSTKEQTDVENFYLSREEVVSAGKGLDFSIFFDDQFVGSVDFNSITPDGVGTIGYWLSPEFVGRGIMTYAVEYILKEGALHGVKIAVIECAVDNSRSANVPRRLGFAESVDPTHENGPTRRFTKALTT